MNHQDLVVNGTGVSTAFLTTEKVDELMTKKMMNHLGETAAVAKQGLDSQILTKSYKKESGLGPVKPRIFIRRVLPRWQDKLTAVFIEAFGELACTLLNVGKASGEGTRGEIRQLEPADAVQCMKDNWFFTTMNGRKCVLFGAKRAFTKLGCLSSVYVAATANEESYFKMRTALCARMVFSVCSDGALFRLR